MNFAYGIIGIVGVLAAISLGFIVADPQSVIEPRTTMMDDDNAMPMPSDSSAQAAVSLAKDSGILGCEVNDTCLVPSALTVMAGTTVSWSNDDAVAHTVTSGNLDDGTDDIFDSDLFIQGTAFEFTFEEPGTFDYFCVLHPWVSGTVTVT